MRTGIKITRIEFFDSPDYRKRTKRLCRKKLLDQGAMQKVRDSLTIDPKSGDMMSGTNGVRKLRWAAGGRGKSGGVRIIYFLTMKCYDCIF